VLARPKHCNFQSIDAAQLDCPRPAERAKQRKGDLNNAFLIECLFAPVHALVFAHEPKVPLARLPPSVERFQKGQGSLVLAPFICQRRFNVNNVLGDGLVPFNCDERVAHLDRLTALRVANVSCESVNAGTTGWPCAKHGEWVSNFFLYHYFREKSCAQPRKWSDSSIPSLQNNLFM
jgi:hypothetical protein